MKIRNGFVSNSSSSSFILKDKKITTAQAATIMLYGVRKSRLEYDKSFGGATKCGDTYITCMDNAIKWLEEHQEFDEPILFPWTTNFETFLWRDEKLGICVDTCNNQEEYWGMLGERQYVDYEYENEFVVMDSPDEFFALDAMQKFTRSDYMDYRKEQWNQFLKKKS